MPNGVRVVNELIIEQGKSIVSNSELNISNFPDWSLISSSGALKYIEKGLVKNFVPEKIFLNSSIDSVLLKDNNIENIKLKSKTITSDKIADGTITEANIMKNTITTSLLKDRQVTGLKIGIGTIEYENFSGALKEILDIDDLSITKNLLSLDVQNILNNAVIQDKINNRTNILTNTSITGDLTVSGNVNAKKCFNPVYADLAEGYEIDEFIEGGYIVTLNENDKLKKAVKDEVIVGVVSDNFAMCFDASEEEIDSNKKAPVGLIGKVNVLVKGKVKKGDYINVSDIPGIAIPSSEKTKYSIGKALKNKEYEEVDKILCLIFPN